VHIKLMLVHDVHESELVHDTELDDRSYLQRACRELVDKTSRLVQYSFFSPYALQRHVLTFNLYNSYIISSQYRVALV